MSSIKKWQDRLGDAPIHLAVDYMREELKDLRTALEERDAELNTFAQAVSHVTEAGTLTRSYSNGAWEMHRAGHDANKDAEIATLRAAAQQVLEALESCAYENHGAHDPVFDEDKVGQSIAALTTALKGTTP